jgi:hypothetical protein
MISSLDISSMYLYVSPLYDINKFLQNGDTMTVNELLEGLPGVKVAQSKKTQSKLRKSGNMEAPGHYHKKGSDWEDTTVTKPKKK